MGTRITSDAELLAFRELDGVLRLAEWQRGQLFPRVGFVVTDLSTKPEGVVYFYLYLLSVQFDGFNYRFASALTELNYSQLQIESVLMASFLAVKFVSLNGNLSQS